VNEAKELYPMEDWQYDVGNGDTKLGYKDWVLHNLESHGQKLKGKFA
jgi:hypothetical protein